MLVAYVWYENWKCLLKTAFGRFAIVLRSLLPVRSYCPQPFWGGHRTPDVETLSSEMPNLFLERNICTIQGSRTWLFEIEILGIHLSVSQCSRTLLRRLKRRVNHHHVSQLHQSTNGDDQRRFYAVLQICNSFCGTRCLLNRYVCLLNWENRVHWDHETHTLSNTRY